MTARIGDVRKALVLWTSFLTRHQADAFQTPLEVMFEFVKAMDPGVLMIAYARGEQWKLTSASRKYPGLVKAIFSVATHVLGLHGCHAARVANQAKFLSGIPGAGPSVLYWWRTGRRGEPHWMQHDASKRIDLVYALGNDWIKQNIVQFLLADDADLDDKIRLGKTMPGYRSSQPSTLPHSNSPWPHLPPGHTFLQVWPMVTPYSHPALGLSRRPRFPGSCCSDAKRYQRHLCA